MLDYHKNHINLNQCLHHQFVLHQIRDSPYPFPIEPDQYPQVVSIRILRIILDQDEDFPFEDFPGFSFLSNSISPAWSWITATTMGYTSIMLSFASSMMHHPTYASSDKMQLIIPHMLKSPTASIITDVTSVPSPYSLCHSSRLIIRRGSCCLLLSGMDCSIIWDHSVDDKAI